jgi:hypothetical protein
MTPEQCARFARKAALTRWKKVSKERKAPTRPNTGASDDD